MTGRVAGRLSVAGELRRALAAEWYKLWAVRATAATLVSLPFVAPVFTWLFSAGGGREYAGLGPADQAVFDPTAISLQSHLMVQMVVGVLGVLAITTEYGTGMIATTVIAVPRRGILFAAKAVVIAGVTLLAGTVTALFSFRLGQAVIGGHGAPASHLSDPHVTRAVIGMGLYLALIALLGLAVGAILRSGAAALGTVVTTVLILPALSQNLPEPVAGVIARYWPNLAGGRIMTVVADPDLMTPWAGFGLLLATVAVVTAVAYAMFRTRDV